MTTKPTGANTSPWRSVMGEPDDLEKHLFKMFSPFGLSMEVVQAQVKEHFVEMHKEMEAEISKRLGKAKL